MSWSRRMREIHDQGCSAFSSSGLTILLACGRNRELWEQPFWNNKGNNWILPIRFNSVFIYGACPKWLLPDILVVSRGRAPFGQHQESRPLASSNDIPVLNGFVNTIDWDQNQSDLSDLTRNMRRVTGSPWIADFRCWTRPEVAILGADQKERGLWGREWLPELSIPAAGQKDRRLWGREWVVQPLLASQFSRADWHRLHQQHATEPFWIKLGNCVIEVSVADLQKLQKRHALVWGEWITYISITQLVD